MKLSDIPAIRSKIMQERDNVPIMNEMHKFLFRGKGGCLKLRGRVKVQVVKSHLLDFSGYLPIVEEGDTDGEELEVEVCLYVEMLQCQFFCML